MYKVWNHQSQQTPLSVRGFNIFKAKNSTSMRFDKIMMNILSGDGHPEMFVDS